MGEYQPSNCRSCGARIMWVKTKDGKNMPIEYDAELEHEFAGPKGTKPDFNPERMKSHFISCPFADEHRK